MEIAVVAELAAKEYKGAGCARNARREASVESRSMWDRSGPRGLLEDHGLLVEEVEGAEAGVESNGFVRMKSMHRNASESEARENLVDDRGRGEDEGEDTEVADEVAELAGLAENGAHDDAEYQSGDQGGEQEEVALNEGDEDGESEFPEDDFVPRAAGQSAHTPPRDPAQPSF